MFWCFKYEKLKHIFMWNGKNVFTTVETYINFKYKWLLNMKLNLILKLSLSYLLQTCLHYFFKLNISICKSFLIIFLYFCDFRLIRISTLDETQRTMKHENYWRRHKIVCYISIKLMHSWNEYENQLYKDCYL